MPYVKWGSITIYENPLAYLLIKSVYGKKEFYINRYDIAINEL